MRASLSLPMLLSALFAVGCATEPVVAPATAQSPDYRRDLAECRHIAQRAGSGREVLTKGAVGAGVGAATGAIADDAAGEGAAIGAIAGLTAGAFSADREKDRIVMRCLRDRGHTVY